MNISDQTRLSASIAIDKNPRIDTANHKRTRETAQQFEAIFVQQMFKEMRRTIPEGGLLPRGNAEEIFTSMQDMEAARQLTRQGGIGLTEMLVEQLGKRPR